ncbi:hypothetical protein EMA8858_01982 [Emticicia aquatica]|uniref:DUF4249 domain-containing protein n=1 Tax=Emticicia aquatica TaxID=1681835 RepID=A0ABN8EW59_9BACT|nr:DUF4249 domain-containing protein [Emticicia aquatica]CAH0995854.1 hypothetical protein EMA8858_01982 [Emticicia aquatica]
MKKHILLSLLIISQLTIFSCKSLVKEIDPSILPQTDSKLVVACFISPQDTILSAKITETKVLIGSTGDISNDITNASVKISDGTKTVSMIYHSTLGYYRALPSDLPILSGKTYTITVFTPDGRKVNASTSVPNKIDIKEVKVDSTKIVDIQRGNQVTNTEYNVKVIWQDIVGANNFYRALSVFDFIYQIPDPKNNKNSVLSPVSTMVDLRTIDDKNTDGQLISLNRSFQPFTSQGQPSTGQNISVKSLQNIKVGLFHTDSHYYNYHTSLRKQRENNNPFAEPVLLYTNINGGFGCFGAYNASWQEIKAK